MNDEQILAELRGLEIETPSWGYGNSGTRFHVYPVAGRRAHGLGADRRRRPRPPPDRRVPERRRPHPVGPGRRLAGAEGLRRGAGREDRSGQPEPLRRGRVPARQRLPSGSRGAPPRARPLPRVRRDRRAGRLLGAQPLAGRRDELPGPGRPARALRAAHGVPGGAVRRPPGGNAPSRRVQVLRARLLQHRPAGLGHGRARLPPARPAGPGARGHRPPRAGDERGADRRAPARRGAARRLPLQQPQVRGRRPDRRLDRPLRALPHHARARGRPRPTRPPPRRPEASR